MNILLVSGHGIGYNLHQKCINDCGAVGNSVNERDFIREFIVPSVEKYLKQAGHKVSRYGGTKMSQDLFQDTAYGQGTGNYKDYGMYWVARQNYDVVVEFHLDAAGASASGGHVIIGLGLNPDNIDKGIQAAIQKHVGTIRAIHGRDNLLNVNVAKAKGVNYRLVELGFITSKKDMDYIKKNYDAYCKDIADAINGKEINPAKKKPKVTPKVVVKPKVASKVKPKSTKTVVKKETPKKTEAKVTPKPIVKDSTKQAVRKQTTTKKKIGADIIMYTVKAGDSLWAIATANKVTVAQIKEWNKLTSDTIFVGQVLYVTKPTTTTPKPPATPTPTVKNARTKAQTITYAKSLIGKGWDYDGSFGWQCFDLANMVWHYMFSHGLYGEGAKDIPTWNNFTGEAQVIKYTAGMTAQAGDLVVWGGSFNGGYGHVAFITEVYTGGFNAVNQNWLGGGKNKTEVASLQKHPYFSEMWFIRPIYK